MVSTKAMMKMVRMTGKKFQWSVSAKSSFQCDWTNAGREAYP